MIKCYWYFLLCLSFKSKNSIKETDDWLIIQLKVYNISQSDWCSDSNLVVKHILKQKICFNTKTKSIVQIDTLNWLLNHSNFVNFLNILHFCATYNKEYYWTCWYDLFLQYIFTRYKYIVHITFVYKSQTSIVYWYDTCTLFWIYFNSYYILQMYCICPRPIQYKFNYNVCLLIRPTCYGNFQN